MASTRTCAKDNTLLATAHHEAGHAVIAWWVGQRFRHVTIARDNDSLGHVEFEEHPKWFTDAVAGGLSAVGGYPRETEEIEIASRMFIEREIVHHFAGQHAEARYRGRHPRRVIHSDNRRAIDLALHLNIPVDEYLGNCWSVSRELVERFWPQIQAPATALFEEETLDYDAAVKDMAQTEPQKPAAAQLSLLLFRLPQTVRRAIDEERAFCSQQPINLVSIRDAIAHDLDTHSTHAAQDGLTILWV